MEDEDKQLLMMIEDIKEGREDLERMLERRKELVSLSSEFWSAYLFS